jgi:pimeloyl-ACP methyl ester carboxylesterase
MFVHRPDARLFSVSFGQGPLTLLALGGWAASGEVWHELFGHLPHWRCVSFDHRGSGVSTHGGPIGIDAMVDDLFAVADAQAVGRCIVAAESSGAGVVLEAALRQPKRFAGLVLVGASWLRPAPGSQDSFIAALHADHDAALRIFARACLPEAGSDDLQRWGVQILRRAPLQHAIELLQCRSALSVQDRLAELRLPVLLVHGTADAISPSADAKRLAAGLPDAELHLLDGIGHVPIFSVPATVARLIDKRFMQAMVASA